MATREAGAAQTYPVVRQVVLDCTDVRKLAEFYRELLGMRYRPGDEPPSAGRDDADWLVLRPTNGSAQLAFQQVAELPEPTWPEGPRPQMLHLDMTVPDTDELLAQRARVLDLGGRQLLDRFDDPDEPLYVFADPAGHPFCIFVG
ncbi:VOC family protein [Nakamurella sp. GG22]